MMTSNITHTAINQPNSYLANRNNTLKNPKVLPLPPFGKEAALLLSYGVQPRNDIFIFAGLNGWHKAQACKDRQIVLCLPYGKDPANYSWPVKDCPVLLIDTGFLSITDIEKFAYILLCAHAEIVRVMLSINKMVVYRRDAA